MNNEAITLINFYYDKDTVATVNDMLRNNPKNEIWYYPRKGLDTLNLRSIVGFIYLPMVKSADPPKPLLVSDIKLIRMHKKHIEEAKSAIDTLRIDSLESDTLTRQKIERLTPLQMRESQPKEHKINVVKENPNPIHPDRGIPQRTIRRRK